jgi:hypothetical protein
VTDDAGITDPKHDADGRDPLWQELAQVVADAAPVPPEVRRTGHESLTWRTVDAELAELAYDSVVDSSLDAGVRGPEGTRLLSFEAPGLTVELEVASSGARRRLTGQLIPPQRARVMVRHQEGIATVEADEMGRFAVEDLPLGPASLRCHLGGGEGAAPVVTDWFTL